MTTPCVLALDTTTMNGSVAICCNGELRAARQWTAVESHSTRLLQEIEASLHDCSAAWEDLTHLAAVNGPGSFTGIRIGLGTVQGLAHALGKPVLGITALETLACAAGQGLGAIHAVIDARRNQVFHQLFDRNSEWAPKPTHPPQCEDYIEWLHRLSQSPGSFIGSGAILYRNEIEKLGDAYKVLPTVEYLASHAAQIATWRILAGRDQGSATIDALYLRPPDVLLPRTGK